MTPEQFQSAAKEYRKRSGLCVTAWARALKIGHATAIRWEAGKMPDHPEAVLLLMEQVANRRAERSK